LSESEARVFWIRQQLLGPKKPQKDNDEELFQHLRSLLPPLQDPKDYCPSSSADSEVLHFTVRSKFWEDDDDDEDVKAILALDENEPDDGHDDDTSSRSVTSPISTSIGGFEAPAVSQLGVSRPVGGRFEVESYGNVPLKGVLSGAAVAACRAKQMALMAAKRPDFRITLQQTSRAKLLGPAPPHSARVPRAVGGARPQGAPLEHCAVARDGGRSAVQGTDPMAGGLFSRSADIDAAAKQRGIYEAQLRKSR